MHTQHYSGKSCFQMKRDADREKIALGKSIRHWVNGIHTVLRETEEGWVMGFTCFGIESSGEFCAV